jgi:hypothetical protein
MVSGTRGEWRQTMPLPLLMKSNLKRVIHKMTAFTPNSNIQLNKEDLTLLTLHYEFWPGETTGSEAGLYYISSGREI